MNDQHILPVQPLTPNRRGGRLRTVVAAVVPVAILGAVVAGGLLGRAGGAGGAHASPGPAASAVTNSRAPAFDAPRLPVEIDPVEAFFPTDTLGLPVRSVDETVNWIRSGLMRERVVAVAGWLSIRPPSEACRTEVDRGTDPTALCPRDALLVGTPEPVIDVGTQGEVRRLRPPGPHLHPIAMPGVSLGQQAGRLYRGLASLTPVPVVVVGRIGDVRLPECRLSGRHCGESFTLERLIWVDGEWQDRRTLLTTPALEGPDRSPQARRRTIDEKVPGAGTVLSEILLPRDALAGLDPNADAAVDEAVRGPVWYVRFLLRVAGPGGSYPRDVGWAVLEDATGELVAGSGAVADTDGPG